METKCLIFDFDGLIFDTETLEMESYEALYNAHHVAFDRQKWLNDIGTTRSFDPFDPILEVSQNATKEMLIEARMKMFQESLVGKKAREGVEDYLETAKSLGLHIALASSSYYDWVDEHLTRLGLRDYFEFVSTRDDVEKVKPDPRLYTRVIEHFNLDPKEAIAFEDSPNGSLGAIRAGIPVVIVPNITTEGMTFDERVTLRLHSKKDMPLKDLIQKVHEITTE